MTHAGPLKVGFLVCPPEALLDGFVHRPADLDPSLVRAVSSHLSRCAPCREEADRRRRGLEAVRSPGPWLWALAALAVLASCGALLLWHEPARPSASAPVRFTSSFTGRETAPRPDLRIASLARFEPPREAALSLVPPLSPEDDRELAAARSRLAAGSSADAARLLEDLTARNPSRAPLVLLLAYAYARSEAFEKAQWQYAAAEALGAGVEACLGLANASLKVGDVATARRELSEHVLSRRPDDLAARDLLERIEASSQRLPR